jgi:hypothetical protein
MGTRVYAYGCKLPDKETRLAIRDQLWLAHRYRLMLWYVGCAQRAAYRELRREYFPELADLEDQQATLQTKLEATEDRNEAKALRIEMRALRSRLKELRLEASEHAEFQAAATEQDSREHVLLLALRKVFSRVFGLYSGTYLGVEAAARSATTGQEDPARPRWVGCAEDGDGRLMVQLQDGPSPIQIHDGSLPSIYIEALNGKYVGKKSNGGKRSLSRTVAHYRVRSGEGGKAVLVPLHIVMHRPLPADARVKWVSLVVRRIHSHLYKYELHLTCETQANEQRAKGAGLGALCITDKKIQVSCEYGAPETIEGWKEPEKLRDLQSIRDKLRNKAAGWIEDWLCSTLKAAAEPGENKGSAAPSELQHMGPGWLRKEMDLIHEKRSCRRLYHLRDRIRADAPPELMAKLDQWAYRENHLYWWWAGLRTNALRARKHHYREIAAKLRLRFRNIAVDNRRLERPKRKDAVANWLGLAELRLAVLHAFGEDAQKVSGDDCATLCEQFRATQTAGVAHNGENTSGVASVAGARKPKRYGFARQHEAKKQGAREVGAKVLE